MSKPLSRRSRDFFAGIPHLYSASPGSGCQESSYGPAPVTITRSEASVPTNGVRPGNPAHRRVIVLPSVQGAVRRLPEKFPAISHGKTIEFFNLRGQRLPLNGIRHVDGIVLEKIVEPSGKANIAKKTIPKK